MILDAQNQYASAQTVTSTGASTNIIDHSIDRNIGIGEPLAVVIAISAIDATSGDETYTVQVEVAATGDSAFGSPTAIGQLLSVPRGTAVPARFYIPLPPDTTADRYTRLKWTLGGTTPSVTYTAYLEPQRMLQNGEVLYTAGYSIS